MIMKKISLCCMLLILSLFAVSSGAVAEENHELVIKMEYHLEGGYNSILNPNTISANQLPYVLQNPRRDGYNFGGWYSDKGFQKRIYQIDSAKQSTLYAKWNLNINANQNVQDYPYENNGSDILLKELPYGFLYELDTPGNPKTRVDDLLADKFASEYQCPQGLCITPEYYIVSSYALENGRLGALTLYDKATGAYVVSLGMEANSHLGGVSYDGENIWICHSNTKEIECISYEFIKKIARVSKQNFVDISNCFMKYKVNNIPSCITCKDGKLYVATHHTHSPGMLYCYELKDNSLQLKEKCLIPSKVQGIFIDNHGCVWLSQSYGRNQSSHLLVYQNKKNLKKEFLVPMFSVELPPGAEAIAIENEICYVVFETASYKYFEGSDGNGTCKYPIDKILMINCESILYD